MKGPCLCGDTQCPVSGRLQGTYIERHEEDGNADAAYEKMRQVEIDTPIDVDSNG